MDQNLFFFGPYLKFNSLWDEEFIQQSLGRPETWDSGLTIDLYLLGQNSVPSCFCWGKDSIFFSNGPFDNLYSQKYRPRIGSDGKWFFDKIIEQLSAAERVSTSFSIMIKDFAASNFDKSALVPARYTVKSLSCGPSNTGVLFMSCVNDDSLVSEYKQRAANLNCALRHTSLGVMLLATDGECLDANPAFHKMLGYTLSELRSLSCAQITYHEDIAKTKKAYSQAQKARRGTKIIEKRFLKKDGSHFWAQTVISCIRDTNGKLTGMVMIIENIDVRKDYCERLLREKLEAEDANRSKSAFLANMSHEIRTPLGIIIGFSDLLCEDLSFADRLRFTNTLKRNGQHLTVIVNDILDLSKVEAGSLKTDMAPFSLRTILSDVLDSMRPTALGKKLDLELEVLDSIPDSITSDALRIKQILINLVGNALKFTAQGKVGVKVVGNEHEIEIEVFDTGVGIGKADQPLLFSPFQQLNDSVSRKFGGTGLGLSLSKKLAQLLAGNLVLKESREGEGSTFLLTLRNHPGRIKITDLENAKERNDVWDLNGINILLVDDSEDNQLLTASLLIAKGANVAFANDGIEACEMALNDNFDLVLMDIQMPVLNGFAATHKLRDRGFMKPIIALTADAMDGTKQRCLDAGFNDYLSKPIKLQGLLGLIHRCLYNHDST